MSRSFVGETSEDRRLPACRHEQAARGAHETGEGWTADSCNHGTKETRWRESGCKQGEILPRLGIPCPFPVDLLPSPLENLISGTLPAIPNCSVLWHLI